MKKTFTLLAFSLLTACGYAQTESWTVYDENGLKPIYVANPVETEMTVVEFSTEHVKGTHTSGPISTYSDGELVDGKLEPNYNNTWSGLKTRELSSDGSVPAFMWVQGQGNPVDIEKMQFVERETNGILTGKFYAVWDEAYYTPDGANGMPNNGTYVTLTPSVDGTMKVTAWVNKGYREIFIVKESDMKALSFGTDIAISGYIDEQNNDVDESSPLYGYMKYQDPLPMKGTEGNDPYIIEGTKDFTAFVYMTFNVTANETYYIFNKSTQLGFSGYEFTPSDGSTTTETPYILTEVEDNVYAVTMTDAEIEAAYPEQWVADAWGLGVKLPVGTVMFENDEVKITAGCGTPVYVQQPEGEGQPGGNRISDMQALFPEYTGYINGGSSLPEKHWTGTEELYTIVDVVADNHGIPFVYPKVDGTLRFGALAGDNTRSIGIYEWPTDEEAAEMIPGHWVDYSNFRNDGGAVDVSGANVEISVGDVNAPEYVEGLVIAGRVYALIAGGKKNVNLHQISFVPGTETAIKEVQTAAPSDGKIYSIDGRYVGSDKTILGKGLYISNGKKFVVR